MRALAFLITVAVALATAATASAATYTVTGTGDPANRLCNGTSCTSIRAALEAANRSGVANTIVVPAGNYVLSQQSGGQLPVSSDVALVGASAATTTIRGDGKNFRIFDIAGAGRATISHVRLTFGTASTDPTVANQIGGIVLVDSGASLALDHAQVDGGSATRGGGIAIRGGTANITKSVITENNASQDGAGILNLAVVRGAPATLTLTDSTVALNTNGTAAGITSLGNASNAVTVVRSTIAFNSAGSNGGTGLRNGGGTISVSGSILAGNTGDGTSDNCGGTITSGGGNAETEAACGFTRGTDRQNVDNAGRQLVASELTALGETRVLTIPATSVAVGLAGQCTGADQRDVTRPQGPACDAGAYEVDVPPDAAITAGPSGPTTDSAPAFAFTSSEPGVTFQCRLDGPAGQGTFGTCTSPASFGTLPAGDYTFLVRAVDSGGNVSAVSSRSFSIAAVQPAPTPSPTPAPTPPAPVYHQSVVIQPVSGKTLVKLPGATKFTPVDVTTGIPLGSTVDTRKSRIRLFAIPQPGKAAESALFYDGIFKVTQIGSITQLLLVETLAPCPKAGKAAAAAKKPKTRKLWGDGSGSFRTRGQYSAATVRGTRWLVEDSCGKTLTRVAKGVVSVQDFVKHTTKLVRAPHSYIARKKR